MKISEIAIKRNILTLMGVLAVVLLGAVTVFRVNLSMMPDIEFPFVTVQTILPGAAPDIIETDVTDTLEEAISEVSGIKSLNSYSRESVSFIFIEFEIEEDVDIKAQEVRDNIALVRRELPDDTEEPTVQKVDINAFPVLVVNVSGTRSIAELTDYCERELKALFQSVSDVGRIEIIGGRRREIRVWVDPVLLEAKGLAVGDVERALRSNHIEMAGGRITASGTEYIIKTKGEVTSPKAFEDIPVAYTNGVPIRVRDIGRVDDGLEEKRSVSLLNGKPAVAVRIYKKSGGNIVDMADSVKQKVREINTVLPEGINELVITQDMSIFTIVSLAQTRNDLLLGGILAVLIIFLFLRDWRGTVVAASVIPAAIISSFILVYWFGFTFNVITLMAYTICVGMLIDDAIVMVEVIHRYLHKGQSPLEAAVSGSHEIGFAIIATSLTVMAVFVPVAITKGLVGRFLFQFGITVVSVVAISTTFALTLTPTFSSVLFRPYRERKRMLLSRIVESALNETEQIYRNIITFSMEKRWIIVVLCLLLFAGSILIAMFAVEKEFEPKMDMGELGISFEMELGTPLEKTLQTAKSLERDIREFGRKEIKEVFTTVGGGAYGKVNEGYIYVKISSKTERDFTQFEFQDDLREVLQKKYPGLNIKIAEFDPGGDIKGAAVMLSIRGPDFEKLQELSRSIIGDMEEHGGFIEIDTSFETGKPEIPLYIDREAAAREGISAVSIASAVNTLVGGAEVLTYKESGKQYEVRLRLAGAARDSVEDIYSLSVRSPLTGKLILLRNLLRPVSSGRGLSQITRGDRQREITVMSNLDDTKLKLGTAVDILKKLCWKHGLPVYGEKNEGLDNGDALRGYTAKFTGMAEIMKESFASLGTALIIGIVFIYMILAAQFNKFVPPFAVMFSLPLSVVGIFGAMWLTDQTLNIMAQISIIMLMGLVAKNAILLVDYTELLRREGRDRTDAIIEGGCVRLRPILMTALSTIFGMLPAAISMSEGAEMRKTMAICAIGGLITSTFLTLIVVPVAYSLLEDLAKTKLFRIASKVMLVLVSVLLLVFLIVRYILNIELPI